MTPPHLACPMLQGYSHIIRNLMSRGSTENYTLKSRHICKCIAGIAGHAAFNTALHTLLKRCNRTLSFHLTFLQQCLARRDAPRATRRQYPALGRQSTLSATTNPTRKKRLEAGMKGTTNRTTDMATSLEVGCRTRTNSKLTLHTWPFSQAPPSFPSELHHIQVL